MVPDKYIGLGLSIAGSVAIGTSFIITKKGLNDAATRTTAASEDLRYLRNPIWWTGTCLMVVGEIANFAAYSFAPPILVTPLGFLSVLIGAILASFFLQEELGHIGRVGCTLCVLGAIIIVAHAPSDQEVQSVDEILQFALQTGFLLYCATVVIFTLIMIYNVAPRHGKKNPLVYMSICSLVGSLTVMASKGFGIALKLTFGGNNQLNRPSTYVFGLVCALCIIIQMNYFNKALDTFSTNVVNPIYYVGFTTCTIFASFILFQDFYVISTVNIVSLIAGFLITFFGVHLLNLSLDHESFSNGHHLPLENGLITPRVSLTGRVSLDGWAPSGERHRRSNSLSGAAPGSARAGGGFGFGRSHSHSASRDGATVFNAYDDDRLNSLPEDEEEFFEESTELSALNRTRGVGISSNSPSVGGRQSLPTHHQPPRSSRDREGSNTGVPNGQ